MGVQLDAGFIGILTKVIVRPERTTAIPPARIAILIQAETNEKQH